MKGSQPITVMKFGGGCLQTPQHFRWVASIIAKRFPGPVVVVSAVSGVTDILSAALQEALRSEDPIRDVIGSVIRIHLEIINHGLFDETQRSAAKKQLIRLTAKLARLLTRISSTKKMTPFMRAHILSFGERLSARLLAAALREQGIRGVPLDSERTGMITDDNAVNATAILPKVTQCFSRQILPLVENGIVPVVTGFYGCTSDFRLTLFGRNGSDYSAAVAAQASRARALEIWKDVPGFMSADPELVASARQIRALSYHEAAELASLGAQILHPRTVDPVITSGIPIDIKDLRRPEDPGTRISSHVGLTKNGPKSIAHSRDAAILKVSILAGDKIREVTAEFERVLHREGITIYSIITTPTGLQFLISKKDAIPGFHAVRKTVTPFSRNALLEQNIALIGIVGHGLNKIRGFPGRIFSTLDRENITLEMFVSGASPHSAYFIVKATDSASTVIALHREFFQTERATKTLTATE